MRVEIRRIAVEEGSLLMQVRLLALLDAPYAFAGTYIESVQHPSEHWSAQAAVGSAGGTSAIYLAHAPDGVVGIAGAYQPEDDPDARNIYGVWVEPALRGQGLARRLVETVVAWAESAGAERCQLWVAETNAPAVALYDALGFEDTGLRQPFPSDPTVILRRLVRPAGRGQSGGSRSAGTAW
ncbi:MAG: GNAT family N-acetyltransferase [Acidimicrobiia bacterium]